jgi:hypothetical protein
MFVVDGEQVSVRIGNAVHPLLPARQPIGGTAAELPRPQAGVHVVETTLAQRPAPAAQGSAPPPRAGISLRSQPASSGGVGGGASAERPPAAAAPATPAAAPPAPAAPAAGGDKVEPAGGDDASARFSLLELD